MKLIDGNTLSPQEALRLIRARHLRVSATRWTLGGLLGIVFITAVSAHFAAAGSPSLGACLLLFAVSMRIAIVDYSVAGDVATTLVMLCGFPMILLGILRYFYIG